MTGPGLQHSRSVWFPLAIAGGLVLLTAWLGHLAESPRTRGQDDVGHIPDYFVEDFNATAFDTSGQPRYRLAAVRMTHFMDDDTTELTAPRFVSEGIGMARVVVRSLRGLVSGDGENVHFLGDVRMLRDQGHGGAPLELTTEYLRVLPNQDRISTDKPVRIRDGSGEVRGAGLFADGKARTLELAGRVRSTYEVHH